MGARNAQPGHIKVRVTQNWMTGPRGSSYLPAMSVNWYAVLWRGLSDEARNAARNVRNAELKLQAILVAAQYIARAIYAERTGANERDGNAT